VGDERFEDEAVRAIGLAREAWERALRDLPSSPMSRTAAVPATGVLAAAILDEPQADARELAALTDRAIAIARRAWERTHPEPPGNPIASVAERAVVGIVAAGVLRSLLRSHKRLQAPQRVVKLP
jgi:hypothetical protein